MEEKKYPIVEAIERVTGRRVSHGQAIRWARKGRGGVVLRCWRRGPRRVTTLSAVRDVIRKACKTRENPNT